MPIPPDYEGSHPYKHGYINTQVVINGVSHYMMGFNKATGCYKFIRPKRTDNKPTQLEIHPDVVMHLLKEQAHGKDGDR